MRVRILSKSPRLLLLLSLYISLYGSIDKFLPSYTAVVNKKRGDSAAGAFSLFASTVLAKTK